MIIIIVTFRNEVTNLKLSPRDSKTEMLIKAE